MDDIYGHEVYPSWYNLYRHDAVHPTFVVTQQKKLRECRTLKFSLAV